MSRLIVRNGVFAGGPFRGGLGEVANSGSTPDPSSATAASSVSAVDIAKLDERTSLILKRLDEEAKNRRIALMIAGASALFAAVKLGIIAFPHLRSRVGRL